MCEQRMNVFQYDYINMLFIIIWCALFSLLCYICNTNEAETNGHTELGCPLCHRQVGNIFVQLLGDEHHHVITTIRKDYRHSSDEAC